jgi:putative photosynthetic complex assembly protein 2
MIASNHWFAVFVTVFAWWFSTGLILILVRTPRRYHRFLLASYGVISVVAAFGLFASANANSIGLVYCGFFCALTLWGWHEASFLMGVITGPRPMACPSGAKGWRRFYFATATLIYHEIALFLTLVAIVAMSHESTNKIGLYTFAVLFAMRLSSKLNIFLGVPNLTDEFFPDHLAHLKTYLPKRAMNPLMPLSLIGALAAIYWQWSMLTQVTPNSPSAILSVIVLTLTILGMIEHVFMITPLPDAVLWRWASPAKAGLRHQKIEIEKQDHV